MSCLPYQSLLTSEDWEPRDVWRFYNHRADCERVFRVGKQVPTNERLAQLWRFYEPSDSAVGAGVPA